MSASSPSALVASPGRFAGLWIPLVTPFRQGRVDHAALAALTQRLAPTGIAGLVVGGSTGEAAALQEDELWACLATVAAHAGGLPLMLGVAGEQLDHARARVLAAGQLATTGVPTLCGLLVSAPHYIRPSQAGVRAWFEALADASVLPLVIYDIPYRTGVHISRDTLLALAAHPRIQAIKDCGGDLGKTLALLADGRLAVLAGEDLQLFSHLALGAAGAISASAHLRTRDFVQLMQDIEAGRLAAARRRWHDLTPLIEALFAEPNPAPLKAALAAQGLLANELRPPMQAAVEAQRLLHLV